MNAEREQEQPLFDMYEHINSLRKMFPYISDEYWSLIMGMSHIRGHMDWNEYGNMIAKQPWIDSDEGKELIGKCVQTIMKQYL